MDAGLVAEAGAIAGRARTEMGRRIVGKEKVLHGILMGVIGGGHVLLEGVPGLAKTLAVKTFAEISGLDFSRVQFTPDLLPADITGTLVYEQGTGRFTPRKGPLFANVILADEVNRAPAKVQSALLEAMEEGQVTIGEASHALPEPFFVLATQNPIEHEGTYPLPEAQLDRFLLKIVADYPSAEEESAIVRRVADRASAPVSRVLGAAEIALLRKAAESVAVDEAILGYIVRLVRATRPGPEAPAQAREFARWLEYGASPRASLHLYRCARISALLDGRAHALPDDVKACAREVLRHRLVLSYQAEADGVDADAVIARLLAAVPLP
ncbi:MAG: AAA family ATPase [Spirochaetaceae bacterium]|nr:AAA family ATPase [Spirochaetaceae bacterium]